ncbi:hypothetical protein NECAME_04137 [Necator americanus]|uniref:Uncharacterized protein n=1 Tax=Necator americanus TaxID=51031 RepID=W2SX56_NECAM|nr:hypothetical protein NECAME_04137 [Necator americanus]ETN74108.1 hypothetical protein NECAME_04137 [Necator americanus]
MNVEMGGGHHEPFQIPNYSIYNNYRQFPELAAHEKRLAQIGLKDPWIRSQLVTSTLKLATTPEELHIGTDGLQWNEQGERLSEFIMTTKTTHGNSLPKALLSTLEVGVTSGRWHTEIDHIIVSERFCLTDVAVVPKFYTGLDHRLLRGRFSFTRREEKPAKFRERSPRTITNWDLFAALVGFWEN